MRMISWWISSRSSGVLNEVCSSAMVSWVILSAEVSISSIACTCCASTSGPFPRLIDQCYQLSTTLDDELGVGIEQVEELRFSWASIARTLGTAAGKKNDADFISL
jgi:hypothetical protein